jgi:protein-S-isoprenylcysteine O-methyltransferase Ste14
LQFGRILLANRIARRNMNRVNDSVPPTRIRSIHLALLLPFVYQAVAVLCLRHWRSADPWRDLDEFSGGFVALTLLLLGYEIQFKRRMLQSREAIREAAGLTYDPATVRWGSLQAVTDLAVFLDYSHWHFVPMLRKSALQTIGLVLYAIAVAALMWTDTCLARHFQGALEERRLMTTGPFAIVRHPRYAGLLLAKLGFALVFASVFGWFSLLASLLLVRRRIRLEEAHLQEIFGPGYWAYMQRRPRMLPGIY